MEYGRFQVWKGMEDFKNGMECHLPYFPYLDQFNRIINFDLEVKKNNEAMRIALLEVALRKCVTVLLNGRG